MKKLNSLKFIVLLFLFVTVFVSCKKKPEIVEEIIPVVESTFKWYCFFDGKIKEIERPSYAIIVPEKAWTEAVRISSISCAAEDSEGSAKGYAIVNRLGIIVFDGDSAELCGDSSLFDRRTAGNLVFEQNVPLFSIYKSAFFNNSPSRGGTLHPFLVQFNPYQKISYPVLSVENLGFDYSSEITDFVWDGDVWTCSVKTNTTDKVEFSYLTFQTKESLLSISPENAASSILVSSSNMDRFRAIQTPSSLKYAPERLLQLVKSIPQHTNYSITCYTAGGHSPRTYISGDKDFASANKLVATAVLSEIWSGVLFEDGTMFFNGAIPGHKIVNNGRNVALRLPKLPAGFIYSGFLISGSTLYASWEETSFFKTARSGFIKVSLDRILK